MEFMSNFFALVGLCSWSLILFSLKKRSEKCTYDIVKITTTLAMILGIIGWVVLPLPRELLGDGSQSQKWSIIFGFLMLSQVLNGATVFNLYSFVFEFRTPKIDLHLPHGLTFLLGLFLPFSLTMLALFLDHCIHDSSLRSDGLAIQYQNATDK